jgi:hypothetical protein
MSNNYSLLTGLKKLNNKKPDHLWAQSSKQRMLTYLAENSGAQSNGPVFYFNFRPAIAIFVLLGVICLTGVGTIFAAKNSLPGQPLYAVKRLTEQVRLVAMISQNQKNVLRAELLTTRVDEVEVLAYKVQSGVDGNSEKNLVNAVANIRLDINNFKNELNGANPISDNIKQVEQGSLPVQDGKTMADLILSPDVQKSLNETKDLLAKQDLTTALTKAGEITDKLNTNASNEQATDTTNNNASTNNNNSTSTDAVVGSPTTTPAITPALTLPVAKPVEKIPDTSTQIAPSQDFKTDIIKEDTVNSGLIREK